VRDPAGGTNLLVSVDTNGLPSDGASYEPAISADGRYVAFISSGDNLGLIDANNAFDIFRRDLLTGSTSLVSVNTSGTKSALGRSRSPIIAGNGRYMLFVSTATDLAPVSVGVENLFCRDMTSGTTFALTPSGVTAFSVSRDSTYVAVVINGPVPRFSVWNCASSSFVYSRATNNFGLLKISPDGQRIAYYLTAGVGIIHALDWATGTDRTIGPVGGRLSCQFSGDGNLFVYTTTASQVAEDTNGVLDVYLYDFQFGTNSLISRSYPGGAANDMSYSADISSDGRFIAYQSVATNIVPQDTNGMSDVFVYDRVTQTTTLLSARRFGNRSGNQISMAPFFSADGKTLIFKSWASDLVPHDFNSTGDIFAYGLSSGSSIPVFYAKITPDVSTAPAWWITWPALPGNVYRIQFKNDIGDSWHDLAGNVTILGGQGFLRDPGPAPTQRYYRVVAYMP